MIARCSAGDFYGQQYEHIKNKLLSLAQNRPALQAR